MTTRRKRVAFVYGATLGHGGLGVEAGQIARALAREHEVHAIGPGCSPGWTAPHVVWHQWTAPSWSWQAVRPLRRYAGLWQHRRDKAIGRFAARALEQIKPDLCYTFTQVGFETLCWAHAHSVPAILENPNGHLRAFRQVYVDEAARWTRARYLGHPTEGMVRRVEGEYELAARIRVSSEWAKRSMHDRGAVERPIDVLAQTVDTQHYAPPSRPEHPSGPLRLCFVGTVDFRKGFVYLLRAMRRVRFPVSLEVVGGTSNRSCRAILEKERQGLDVTISPGDPRHALMRAELFVLPTLEDGFSFAIAEAMSMGLPVITTTAAGAAEWVTPARSGWIVPPASEDTLVAALEEAFVRRPSLPDMGREARAAAVTHAHGSDQALVAWIRLL